MPHPRKKQILAAMARGHERHEEEMAEVYHSRARKPQPKRSKSRYPLEADEQKAVVAWLRDRGEIVVSPLNGAHLAGRGVERVKKWAQLVAMGGKKSAPDLTWYRAGGAPVLIEMKRQRAAYGSEEKADDAVSGDQRRLHGQLRALGYMVLVGYGVDDAIQQLRSQI
jgi:hypothetical protein